MSLLYLIDNNVFLVSHIQLIVIFSLVHQRELEHQAELQPHLHRHVLPDREVCQQQPLLNHAELIGCHNECKKIRWILKNWLLWFDVT